MTSDPDGTFPAGTFPDRKTEIPWGALFTRISDSLGTRFETSLEIIAAENSDPFRVLVSTIISLRTRDEVTLDASRRLLAIADTPHLMARLTEETVRDRIYPAGFYRTKARQLIQCARIIEERFGGTVPDAIDDLLTLPGVGRKTANLVLGTGFGIPAICVDTHVHRIPNRVGWIRTKTPEQTEQALELILPREYWIPVNGLLVGFGQKTCTPQSPHCSRCPLESGCGKIGVTRRR